MKDTIIRIMVLIIFIAIAYFVILSLKNQAITQQTKPEVATIEKIVSDSIQVADKLILDKLCPIFIDREGFSDTIYFDKKGYAYIGYGHLITDIIIPKNIKITKERAKEILITDIRKAYFERQRILRKSLYNDVYSIFISGKLNCKEK